MYSQTLLPPFSLREIQTSTYPLEVEPTKHARRFSKCTQQSRVHNTETVVVKLVFSQRVRAGNYVHKGLSRYLVGTYGDQS